jgi:LacI family transcriptional regulator
MSVRMRDVAERAGVSPQTVSRVLRDGGLVAPGTAARVRAAMQELGYLGNEAAGALKRGQTRMLGLLCPLLTMPFWSEVAAGVESEAHAHGYSLFLCDTSDSLAKEAAYIALLLGHRVAGIIYVLPRCRPDRDVACAALLGARVPVVVISSNLDDLPYCHVRTDDVRAGYVAVRHLLDLGRRRPALVATAGDTAALVPPGHGDVDRLAGAGQALEEAGIDPYLVPLFLASGSVEGGRAIGEFLLAGETPLPDALLVTTDTLALGILEILRAHGVRVPEDIAIVAHDGLLETSVAVPSLTTIAPPRQEMGRACVDLLLCARTGKELPPAEVLDAVFVARESTLGAGPAHRQGIYAPLSDPRAWSRWREGPAAYTAAPTPSTVTRGMLGDLLPRKEVMQPG